MNSNKIVDIEFKFNSEYIENNTNVNGFNKIDMLQLFINKIDQVNGIIYVDKINIKHFVFDTLLGKRVERTKILRDTTINLCNFYIDIATKKVYTNIYLCDVSGIIKNTKFEVKLQHHEFSWCMIALLTILFLISLSCYFSGWSNVGGIPMTHKKFEIMSICENNKGIYGYFNISENYYKYKYNKISVSEHVCNSTGCKYMCELFTGYTYNSKLDCLRIYESKYKINSVHDIFYDDSGEHNCITISESNTLSMVGFCTFIVLIVLLLLYMCALYSYEQTLMSMMLSNYSYNVTNNLKILQNILLNKATQHNIRQHDAI